MPCTHINYIIKLIKFGFKVFAEKIKILGIYPFVDFAHMCVWFPIRVKILKSFICSENFYLFTF